MFSDLKTNVIPIRPYTRQCRLRDFGLSALNFSCKYPRDLLVRYSGGEQQRSRFFPVNKMKIHPTDYYVSSIGVFNYRALERYSNEIFVLVILDNLPEYTRETTHRRCIYLLIATSAVQSVVVIMNKRVRRLPASPVNFK